MPIRSVPLPALAASRRRRYAFELEFSDFGGGLLLDHAEALTNPRFTNYALNVQLLRDGSVVQRLGCNTIGTPGNGIIAAYWSQALSFGFIQLGTTIYRTTDFNVGYASIATVTTSAAGYFTDYLGKLVYVHPVDGVFTYDGTTWALATAAVKGTMAAVWQNKLWVAGDPGAATTLKWTDAGAMTFGASNFVLFRDVDDSPITAIGAGQGFDALAKPTLLVFKRRSTHRVNDSTTGAYTTLSSEAGATAPRAVTSYGGFIYAWCPAGIYRTDGISIPQRISGNVQRLFSGTPANTPAPVAFALNGHVYFAFNNGSTGNRHVLDYHVDLGAFTAHQVGGTGAGGGNYDLAATAAYQSAVGPKLLVFPGTGTPSATAVGQWFDGPTPAADGDFGSAYASVFRTAFFRAGKGRSMWNELELVGRSDGTATVTPYLDYGRLGPGPARTIPDPLASYDAVSHFYGFGAAESIAFEFAMTTAVTGFLLSSNTGLYSFGTTSRFAVSALRLSGFPIGTN